jgi:hypothetical protein
MCLFRQRQSEEEERLCFSAGALIADLPKRAVGHGGLWKLIRLAAPADIAGELAEGEELESILRTEFAGMNAHNP